MTPAAGSSVVYALPDKMGGVMSIVAGLLHYRCRDDGLKYGVVLTDSPLDVDTRFGKPLDADWQTTFRHWLPMENVPAVLRRFLRRIPSGGGVLVSNDLLELAACHIDDPGRAVVQMLHGDHEYYYALAVRHEPVIDAYVAYSKAMFDTLCRLLPKRTETIFHLPYGIALPPKVRSPADRGTPLRLVFAGRLSNEQKGIFDLPGIDRRLAELGAQVVWTIVGEGPDALELRRRWRFQQHVRFLGAKSNAETVALLAEQDVFVLPTRNEGFPVALLEGMGAGLVPVVSAIASGVPEVVGLETGYTPPVGDVDRFAAAVAELARDRDQLEAMSRNARRTVVERFDIRERVAGYQALYARWRELRRPRPREIPLPYGSRLDRPWMPNALVLPVRAGLRLCAGKRIW